MLKPDSTASENLRKLDIAAYEWLGLLYYRWKGYSDELFPRPAGGPDKAMPYFVSEKPPTRSTPPFPSTGLEDAEEKANNYPHLSQ